MDKIIVTEEQETSIKYCEDYTIDIDRVEYLRNETTLSLVTIARIVEGEPYEVNREFKDGDIVWSHLSDSLRVIYDDKEKKSFNACSRVSLASVNKNKRGYDLICKAEDRHDLKHTK